MSSTVQSQGFIAVLTTPIPKDQMEDVLEKLYNGDDGFIKITFDGKLLYSDDFERLPYNKREFNGDLFVVGSLQHSDKKFDFIEAAAKAGLPIDATTIQPYTAIWYNGSDSPMSLYSLEKFQAPR